MLGFLWVLFPFENFTTGGKCAWLENVSLCTMGWQTPSSLCWPSQPMRKLSKKCYFFPSYRKLNFCWEIISGKFGQMKNMENRENFQPAQILRGFLTTKISSLINQVTWRFFSWCQGIRKHLEQSSRGLDSSSPFCQKLDQNLLRFQLAPSHQTRSCDLYCWKDVRIPWKGAVKLSVP